MFTHRNFVALKLRDHFGTRKIRSSHACGLTGDAVYWLGADSNQVSQTRIILTTSAPLRKIRQTRQGDKIWCSIINVAKTTPEKIKGVYERKTGSSVWWIRWTDHQGKLRREKVGRRSDAITLLAKRKTETLQRKKLPENFKAKSVTFAQLCDDALEHSRAHNGERSTCELELKINRLREVFRERRADSFNKQEIVRWLVEEGETRDWKPATRNRWQAAFSLIFRVAVDNEKIEVNPASRIKRRTENNGRVRYLSADEEAKLRISIEGKFPAFLPHFLLSVHTGMRLSEQYGLRWRQVDFQLKQIHLPKTKNGKPRHIPLNVIALGALREIEKQCGEAIHANDPVFPSFKTGNALKGSRGWFPDAVSDAELQDYTWHCNRHTFASRLVMAGVNLTTVGELMGHKGHQMTLRYAHLAPEHKQAAVDTLVPAGRVNA
jgi:integrase